MQPTDKTSSPQLSLVERLENLGKPLKEYCEVDDCACAGEGVTDTCVYCLGVEALKLLPSLLAEVKALEEFMAWLEGEHAKTLVPARRDKMVADALSQLRAKAGEEEHEAD